MNASEIQDSLVVEKDSPFYWGRNFVALPNSNSFTSWEADLLICSRAGFLTEIEIKVNIQDWRNDKKKRKFIPKSDGGRAYGWGFIKQFYYAVPAEMAHRHVEIGIPEWAGVYSIEKVPGFIIAGANLIKPAQILSNHRKLTDKQLLEFARLAAIRIWTTPRRYSEPGA